MDELTLKKKVLIVLGGYALAFVVAFSAVQLYILATGHIDRQLYSGMSAFGDALFFLAVLGAASLPATAAALFFLRGYRPLWAALAVAGVAVGLTGAASLLEIFLVPTAPPHSWLLALQALTPLRVLAAPFFATAFVLAALFSPIRRPRLTLFVLTTNEALVFSLAVLHWVLRYRVR